MSTLRSFLNKQCIILNCALTLFFAAGLLWIYSIRIEPHYLNRSQRMSFLIDELVSTPKRQQRALDEIVKDESGAFVYLLPHLTDRRSLASKDVLFLNTHARSFEKYFHAGGTRIDETILRYLCWKTARCDVGFNSEDTESMKVQRDKIKQYISDTFIVPSDYEK